MVVLFGSSRKSSYYYWRRRWKLLLLLLLLTIISLLIGRQLFSFFGFGTSSNNRARLDLQQQLQGNNNNFHGHESGSRAAAARVNGVNNKENGEPEDKEEEVEAAADADGAASSQRAAGDIQSTLAHLSSFISVANLQQQQQSHNHHLHHEHSKRQQSSAASSGLNLNSKDAIPSNNRKKAAASNNVDSNNYGNCNMNTCFNFTKCYHYRQGINNYNNNNNNVGGYHHNANANNFKIYVYPIDTFAATPISSSYQKILNSISSSSYFTHDPSQACLFVLAIDTLDRDELSREYVRNVESRLTQLELWNNGENHIIFNLYAGTWPSYNETEMGFTIGKAILAQASISVEQYRPNFDISIPLFHGTHSEKGEEEANSQQGVQGVSTNFPDFKKHLISFKGKRYVYGIGSETRNSIYHLHNRRDVIMVTTCKHGKNWKDMKDDRCDQDNIEYEKYDYETLLQNSTFCLVPRGRRLGSFRFLEVLQAGCIPVILSNGWILPFSEVLDWTQAAIIIDERNLLHTLEIIRSISHKRIFQLKQQTQILWRQYLESIKKIIDTTFEIMRDRIHDYSWRDLSIWNSAPGGLAHDIEFADSLARFPFGSPILVKRNFTAVIYVHASLRGSVSSSGSGVGGGDGSKAKSATSNHYYNSNVHLLRLVRTIGKSQFVSKILIVWDSTRPIPKTWPELSIPLTIKRNPVKSVMQRFVSIDEVETDAIFSLDEDTIISTDEVDFAYHVWSSFPDRIVGYSTRSHYWDEANETWKYSSKWTNDYSLVLNGGSMYHVYYNYIFNTKLPLSVKYLIESLPNCEDILLNILISQLNNSPPIKLIWKKIDLNIRSQWNPDHFIRQQTCLNQLYEQYGTIPLKRSNVRFDPILYKDPVSNLRKKYRQVEF